MTYWERRRRGTTTEPMTSVTRGKQEGLSSREGMKRILGSEERKKERERATDRRGGKGGEDRPERKQ
jgi:hypothetical protein